MHLVILTICFAITTCSRRHVVNSVKPFCDEPPVYDISSWVNKLHLQRCVIVEIGHGHCALFIESTEASPIVREYFLGICEREVIMKWRLCNSVLEDMRPVDCIFNNETVEHGIRVHRKLCDISNLAYYGEACGCDTTLGGIMKNKVCGFPTCFINPLPASICSPLNVCGHNMCNATTTAGKIHMATCNSNCLGKQPFCEIPEYRGHMLEISSFWTDWGNPLCDEPSCSTGMVYMEATCINSVTGAGAVDCLGPGTSCCPRDVLKCKCNTFMENGVLKVYRTYVKPLWNHTEKRRLLKRFKRNARETPDERFLKRIFGLVNSKRKNKRVRTVETQDYEDEDEESDDSGGEDIAIEEEDADDEKSSSTTESPEKFEMKLKMKADEVTVKSSNITAIGDADENDEKVGNSCMEVGSTSIEGNIVFFVLFTLVYIF